MYIDVCITFSPTKVKSYLSLKDKTPFMLNSNVVYKYVCQVDPGCTYIGKTQRHLFKRIREHEKSNTGSKVFTHTLNCSQCKSSFSDRFSIIDSSSHSLSLNILEALHIKHNNPVLNKQLHQSGSSFLLNIFN